MGSIGACCCGCDSCCIARVDVDFAVPEPGQPGASFGSWGWDVVSQPTATETTQTIDGIPRVVCRQVYTAPVITIPCPSGAVLYNTRFLTRSDTIDFDYWYDNNTFGPDFTRIWFQGQMLWETYAYVTGLTLTVDRWGGLARTRLSGSINQHAYGRPTEGSIWRAYNRQTCVMNQEIIAGDPSLPPNHALCAASADGCFPLLYYNLLFSGYIAAFSINRDSGWVAGDCSSLPTNDIRTALDFASDQYRPLTAPSAAGSQSTCRVPTGSTPGTFWSGGPLFGCIPGGPTVIAQSYTYTTPDIWFSRHPLTITPCGADDPIDDEEESPP